MPLATNDEEKERTKIFIENCHLGDYSHSFANAPHNVQVKSRELYYHFQASISDSMPFANKTVLLQDLMLQKTT